MCHYLSVPWCTGSHTGVTQDRGFAHRTCWLGCTHTRGCLMNQAAKDEDPVRRATSTVVCIQHKASCSTFRNFVSWEPAACPSLPSETPDGTYSQEKKCGTLHWLCCGCALEPQPNSSVGTGGWWHFFPLAFLLAGNQERSCGRI